MALEVELVLPTDEYTPLQTMRRLAERCVGIASGSGSALTAWLRGSGELGFPWGVLGYSQVPFLPALQLACVAGLTGLTFWIVAVNALLAGLSDLLRRALDSRYQEMVTLGEELDFVREFLEIQEARFPDRLRQALAATSPVEMAIHAW